MKTERIVRTLAGALKLVSQYKNERRTGKKKMPPLTIIRGSQ